MAKGRNNKKIIEEKAYTEAAAYIAKSLGSGDWWQFVLG
jgi:hypothetical protein